MGRKSIWGPIALLFFAAISVSTSSWLALKLIVNPQSLIWVNRFLPNWIPVSVVGKKPPQTLQEIQAEIGKAGQVAGELMPLGTSKSTLDNKSTVANRLLPIWVKQPACQSNCDKIVELRLYQAVPFSRQQSQPESHFQLVDQVAIAGPAESFVVAPFVEAHAANQGSSRLLPLSHLSPFASPAPKQGTWLNLSGQWIRSDTAIAYGIVIHYNPERLHLSTMLEWSSIADQPLWQEVTGGGFPELVINQTVGMEPRFRVYQVKPRKFLPNPILLEPISLNDFALANQTYQKGVILARQGLWSTGWQWLRSVKRSRKGWTTAAQAQLDLIRLHAQSTQTQAQQSWASPNQQVLANLIDGRWARALQVFEASPENSLDTAALLQADSGRLLNRIETALQINPTQLEAKTWGALLIAAQRGRSSAIAWLKKQPQTSASDISRISRLTTKLTE